MNTILLRLCKFRRVDVHNSFMRLYVSAQTRQVGRTLSTGLAWAGVVSLFDRVRGRPYYRAFRRSPWRFDQRLWEGNWLSPLRPRTVVR